jgi:tRNA 2-thiouridine synthesizing protein A
MSITILDFVGLNCPLPVLKTRKALQAGRAGDLFEVRCTDPMALIDIPVLIGETGDNLVSTERGEIIVFRIEKAAISERDPAR